LFFCINPILGIGFLVILYIEEIGDRQAELEDELEELRRKDRERNKKDRDNY